MPGKIFVLFNCCKLLIEIVLVDIKATLRGGFFVGLVCWAALLIQRLPLVSVKVHSVAS